MILHLSGHRRSCACVRHSTGGRLHAGDTMADCCALKRSLAFYQWCMQQFLGLTRADGHAKHRQSHLKVVGLAPASNRPAAQEVCCEGKHKNDGDGNEGELQWWRAPLSAIRWCLALNRAEEREQGCHQALFRWETQHPGVDRQWHGAKRQQPVGPGQPCHAMRQCCAEPLMHGSPVRPPSFAKFTAVLRRQHQPGTGEEEMLLAPDLKHSLCMCVPLWWQWHGGWARESLAVGVPLDDEEMEEEAKARRNRLVMPEDNNNCDTIMPTTARKTKKEPATMLDLHQHYSWAGQVGSLAGISTLWTSLGRRPAQAAMGKSWPPSKVTCCTAWSVTASADGRTSCLGWENSCSATWWTAVSIERPTTAPGIFSVA